MKYSHLHDARHFWNRYYRRFARVRILGVSFLLLAFAGQLGGPFPYFAGIGDIITGAFALPTALSMGGKGATDLRVLAWNAFGLLDLVVAVALGVTSGNGSPLQVFHIGAGSTAISTLPWSLIPLVLVPVFITGHMTIFARAARASRQSRPSPRDFARGGNVG